jgi:DNA end-binding protein Ku
MLDLAMHIVESKKGKFDLRKFEDNYEEALKELLKKKQSGEAIERPKEAPRSNVVNLMDALRKSLEGEGAKGRKAEKPATAKKSARASKHKKAG